VTVVQYRKKPITVPAIQWTGDNEDEVAAFADDLFREVAPSGRGDDPDITAEVLDTLHKTWVGVKTGQWVIKGVAGEFYPIDEAVLAATYDRVEA
jgi:hypothetical protein